MSTTAQTLPEIAERMTALARMVGNTPLLEISLRYRGMNRKVFAKCEHMNLTGSIKDRMALHILRTAYQNGEIHPGDRILEASSGNTGISFAAIGRALGNPVTIYMPDWMSAERRQLIASFGAEVIGVSHEQGGFLGAIGMAERRGSCDRDVFLPRQFANHANVEAHFATTGPELWWQMFYAGVEPKAFVAGVGTGGTVVGVGRFLREKNSKVRIHPVEPAEAPVLSSKHGAGSHRIQGISDEFVPALMDLAEFPDVLSVNDGDAILMAQKLAGELGIGVGISSGANLVAALKAQDLLGADAAVATVFPDDNKKYLSTDLLRQEPVYAGYIAPEVTLLSYRTLPRVCQMCPM